MNIETQTKPRHPGKGTGKARHFNRGRQVEAGALREVRQLIGDRPMRQDMLIEYLHLIQDQYHCIHDVHLAALAELLSMPQAQAYEVASFYAHFDLVPAGEKAPAPITVRVCDSLSCAMQGAAELQAALRNALDAEQVRVVRAPCMGRCDCAPVAEVGHRHLVHADQQQVEALLDAGEFNPEIPEFESQAQYRERGGYACYEACLRGELDIKGLMDTLSESGLRGMGGAGFPTAKKWAFVREEPGPRLMVVNADEGEPGTFKDRYYLERTPHQFLEGMLISAWAVEAEKAYIYLRDEYPGIRTLLLQEISELEKEGVIGKDYIELRRGAGSYVCGEESAMIESIEGKRGYPRQRPPYVAQKGLFGQPTLVNNVETLYWLPALLREGPQMFNQQGAHGRTGLRSYSVSGRVRTPGVKLAPAGITIRELIDQYCEGMAEGHEFKAYLPGGPSGGILPAHMDNIPLDFGTLEPYGCLIGSAAIIVLSQEDSIRDAVLNLSRFFEDESCGQCTPCRVGTQKTVALLEQADWDVARLQQLRDVMCDASICGLGQAAPNPVSCAIKYFPEEVLKEANND